MFYDFFSFEKAMILRSFPVIPTDNKLHFSGKQYPHSICSTPPLYTQRLDLSKCTENPPDISLFPEKDCEGKNCSHLYDWIIVEGVCNAQCGKGNTL